MKNSKWKSFLSLILILIILYLLINRKTVLDQEKNNLNHVTTKETWVSDNYVPDQRVFLNCSGVVYVDEDSVLHLYVYGNSSFTREIELYMNDTYIGNMHDDGQDGDEVAGDEKYSFDVTIQSTELNETFNFYAKCDDIETTHKVLYSYNKKTSISDYDGSMELMNALNEELELKLVNGYVPYEKIDDVVDDLYKFALTYANNHSISIINVRKNDYGIAVDCGDGMTIICDVPLEGVDYNGDENSIEIVTYEPFYSTGKTPLKSFSDDANYIVSNIPYCYYENKLEDSDVTISNIVNSVPSNGIIIWHGHGGYDNDIGSYLLTNQIYTSEILEEYPFDIDEKYILIRNGKIVITSEFIKNYLTEIDNTLVYLGACQSYKDSRLAQAFLDKNASVVFGFTETVYTTYDCAVMDMLSEEMCKGRDMLIFTLYQDIKTSLKNIKNELGDNDIEYAKRYMNVSDYKDSTSFLIAEGNLDYYVGDYLVREKQDSIEKDVLFIKEKFRIFKEELISALDSDEEISISLWEKLKEKLLSWLLDVLNSIDRAISPV